jgi:hypothetical protein
VAEAQGLKAQKGSTEAAREIRMATEFENKAEPEKQRLDPAAIQELMQMVRSVKDEEILRQSE